jgi:hypothetical protein
MNFIGDFKLPTFYHTDAQTFQTIQKTLEIPVAKFLHANAPKACHMTVVYVKGGGVWLVGGGDDEKKEKGGGGSKSALRHSSCMHTHTVFKLEYFGWEQKSKYNIIARTTRKEKT